MPLRDLIPARVISLLSFTRFLGQRVVEGRCLQVAGSLSFTTLLALVPFVTIALALLAPFEVFERVSTQFKTFLLTNLVPDTAGRIITVYMRQFTDNAERLTVMGIIVLAITAIMLISTIDRAFTAIWQTAHRRPFWQRLMLYWTILTLAPILIGLSLSLVDQLFALLPDFKRSLNWLENLLKLGLRTTLGVMTFALLFHFAPNRQVPWRHAVLGGLFTGISFELLRSGFAIYVKKLAGYKLVYGAFAALPIFLVWLYLLWSLVLVGATLTASLSYWRAGAWRTRRGIGREFQEALRILQLLHQAHGKGVPQTTEQIRHHLGNGMGDVSQLMIRLERKGWVLRLANHRWVLGQELDQISLLQLYRALIWDTGQAGRLAQKDDAVNLALRPLLQHLDQQLELSVADLLQQGGEALDKLPAPETAAAT